VIGRAKFNGFAARAAELIEDRPELIAVISSIQLADLGRLMSPMKRPKISISGFLRYDERFVVAPLS
jgi:hypothetical protein